MKKRKSTISGQKTGDGFIGRLFAQTKLPAHVTEEQDWYLDTPDVRLTRVFTVVLILHVVAVGGILAFKMVEKASTPAVVADTSAPTEPPKSNADDSQAAASSTKVATTEPETPAAPAVPAPAPAIPAPASKGEGTGVAVKHPSAEGYSEYSVAAGDTIAGIAEKMGVSAATIKEVNHLDSDANLTPGRFILVPSEKRPASAVAAIEPAKPAPAAPAVEKPALPAPKPAAPAEPVAKPTVAEAAKRAKPGSYQVQKGETLFSIARRFGVKYQDLMAANGIEKAESLRAGQTLRVPEN